MKDKTNNQLAQLCNNLYCILRRAKNYSNSAWRACEPDLDRVISELDAEYNTLFKLIYGK